MSIATFTATVGTAQAILGPFAIDGSVGASTTIQITNTGTTALNSLRVEGCIAQGKWFAIASASTDYTEPPATSLIRFTDGADLTTLAAAATGIVAIDAAALFDEIRITATVASSTTTLEIKVRR